MSTNDPKVNIKASRMLYNLEYEALIERETAARMKREEEERKKAQEKGERKM